MSKKKRITAWKVSKCEVISGPYFPVFGLNSERYGVIHLKLTKNGTKLDGAMNGVWIIENVSGGTLWWTSVNEVPYW